MKNGFDTEIKQDIYVPDIDGFKDFYFNKNKTTIQSYGYCISKFFRMVEKHPSEISKKDVRLFFRNLLETVKVQSHKKFKSALKAYYKYLTEDEIVDNLNASVFDIDLGEVPDVETQTIFFEDALTIIRKAELKATKFNEIRNVMILYIAATTGARASDIQRLTLSDVNLKNKTLFFRVSKSKKPRVVPIPPCTVKIIERYLKIRLVVIKEKTNALLITRYGLKAGVSTIEYLCANSEKVYGIKFGLHAFRRGYISDLIARGASIEYVAELAGHRDIQTTIKHYLRFASSAVLKTASMHPSYQMLC